VLHKPTPFSRTLERYRHAASKKSFRYFSELYNSLQRRGAPEEVREMRQPQSLSSPSNKVETREGIPCHPMISRPEIDRQINSPINIQHQAPNTRLSLRGRRATIPRLPARAPQTFDPAPRRTDSVVLIPLRQRMPTQLQGLPGKSKELHSFGQTLPNPTGLCYHPLSLASGSDKLRPR